ncbi:hypothetical protein LguiA_017067 [Lonicera macranthoides]
MLIKYVVLSTCFVFQGMEKQSDKIEYQVPKETIYFSLVKIVREEYIVKKCLHALYGSAKFRPRNEETVHVTLSM